MFSISQKLPGAILASVLSFGAAAAPQSLLGQAVSESGQRTSHATDAKQPTQQNGKAGEKVGEKVGDKGSDKKTLKEKSNDKGAKASKQASKKDRENDSQWKPMLPTKKLGDWEVTDFGGEGEVEWDGKTLVLHAGDPMTGINYTKKDFPRSNYEIRLKARRVDGRDFFCCLTFPIDDKCCSFVAGGWGGSVTGLSSVNGFDASENETSGFVDFEEQKWYEIRLQVTDDRVAVWIDDEQCVDLEREYAEFDTRIEVFVQQPLGVCSFMTKAELKDFRWKVLKTKASKQPPENTPATEKSKNESSDKQRD